MNKKIIDYQIIWEEAGFITSSKDAIKDLEKRVKLNTKSGWQPLGGVSGSSTKTVHELRIMQAMVKYGTGE